MLLDCLYRRFQERVFTESLRFVGFYRYYMASSPDKDHNMGGPGKPGGRVARRHMSLKINFRIISIPIWILWIPLGQLQSQIRLAQAPWHGSFQIVT